MPHENELLDSRQCRADRRAGALPAHGDLPGRGADAAAQRHQSPGDGGARSALEVGRTFLAYSDGEKIQLTKVTRDFVHWINPITGSHGRMLSAYFLNFFTPFQ